VGEKLFELVLVKYCVFLAAGAWLYCRFRFAYKFCVFAWGTDFGWYFVLLLSLAVWTRSEEVVLSFGRCGELPDFAL